ncbi:hypothetical protein NL676_004394 [Syzygium grande]|nr:hypothetical protein NL676_004394 [Syzygium grande]
MEPWLQHDDGGDDLFWSMARENEVGNGTRGGDKAAYLGVLEVHPAACSDQSNLAPVHDNSLFGEVLCVRWLMEAFPSCSVPCIVSNTRTDAATHVAPAAADRVPFFLGSMLSQPQSEATTFPAASPMAPSSSHAEDSTF